MRIGIISHNRNGYSTRRLLSAARKRNYQARVFDTLSFAIDLAEGKPDLLYHQRHTGDIDAVIPRIGTSVTYFGTAVVRQFEQMDVYCGNSSAGISNSRDKLRCLQILSRHQIGIPKTTFVRDDRDVLPAIDRVGGAPVVIKLIEGTQGNGVLLAESVNSAEAIIELLQRQRQNVLVQKFIAESRGRDIRAFVVGDQVVAAMRRVAQGSEFRSNVHLGARMERIELEPSFEQSAVRAAQIMGLRIAGVDMLESRHGPLVMEVNSSPGLEGIEHCTQLDVAGAVIDFVAAQVDFPDIDIRQRLTVSRGYGIAEIVITEGSVYARRTIAGAGLSDRDINVLTLHRGEAVLPNPGQDHRLDVGDRLLCFGNLESMRSMMPAAARSRHQSRSKTRCLPAMADMSSVLGSSESSLENLS